MQTNTKWICDKCRDVIESPREGWVQWLTIPDDSEDAVFHRDGLQMVHAYRPDKPKCIYSGDAVFRSRNATTSDMSLERFIGPNGLMKLLSFLAEGDFQDPNQVIEMIKRIHIPGYEEVRDHLLEAANECVFDYNTLEGFPDQEHIQAVRNWLKEKGA